ncbi:MAG: TlpA family protein disulfide reductase [Bacteroides sp.]|nr:TlpA family protein disulfide reductase [Bacteroides sp.]
MSSEFIIDKGLQTISINIDSPREVPEVKNKTMLEEYPNYLVFFEEIHAKYDLFYQETDSLYKLHNYDLPSSVSLTSDQERKALDNASDSTLLRYTEKNPNSKVAFWKLIRLMGWGYEPIFDSIYNAFSDDLKNGYAGQVLKDKLQDSKQLTIGRAFPEFNCQNTNGENLSSDIFLTNKFTLVDFWYSNCGPCLRQFGQLRDLYKQYGDRGFEIVAISVDQVKNKENWENLIVDENLVWKQYWDKNGAESHRFLIHAFPTNFLLDSTGKIIDKNISMGALEEFLNSSL